MTQPWRRDDAELFALAKRELFTCVAGDILDVMGLYRFLPPQVQPLREDMVVLGRAYWCASMDVYQDKVVGKRRQQVDGQTFRFDAGSSLDDLKPGEIFLNTGSSPRNALWGELMMRHQVGRLPVLLWSTAYVRDTLGIYRRRCPTCCWGRCSQDSSPRHHKVVDYRSSSAGNRRRCRINPGDIIFGDIDGARMHSRRDIETEEYLSNPWKKPAGEKKVRVAIEADMPAVRAFEKFGIM